VGLGSQLSAALAPVKLIGDALLIVMLTAHELAFKIVTSADAEKLKDPAQMSAANAISGYFLCAIYQFSKTERHHGARTFSSMLHLV
jgi:hypothetical protein